MNEHRSVDPLPGEAGLGPSGPRRATLLALAVLLALAGATQTVGQAEEPAFSTGPPQVEKVVEEVAYFYRLRRYEPAVEVLPVTRENASYDTAEEATIAAISAMLSGDYEWFLDTWTPVSRRAFEQRNRELQRGADFWIAAWENGLSGKRVELTHRVETGAYVLIAYTIVDPQASAAVPEEGTGVRRPFLTSVLVEVDGRWLATQELAADPVLMFWDRPGYRVEKMGRNIELPDDGQRARR